VHGVGWGGLNVMVGGRGTYIHGRALFMCSIIAVIINILDINISRIIHSSICHMCLMLCGPDGARHLFYRIPSVLLRFLTSCQVWTCLVCNSTLVGRILRMCGSLSNSRYGSHRFTGITTRGCHQLIDVSCRRIVGTVSTSRS